MGFMRSKGVELGANAKGLEGILKTKFGIGICDIPLGIIEAFAACFRVWLLIRRSFLDFTVSKILFGMRSMPLWKTSKGPPSQNSSGSKIHFAHRTIS